MIQYIIVFVTDRSAWLPILSPIAMYQCFDSWQGLSTTTTSTISKLKVHSVKIRKVCSVNMALCVKKLAIAGLRQE